MKARGAPGRKPGRTTSIGRTIAVYAAVFALAVATLCAGVPMRQNRNFRPAEGAEHPLPQRMAWYESRAGDFDLVFLGDSRTYCGIHPEVIDPLLGTASINLSTFAHWFGSQYPQIRDVARLVPPHAVVVWSIGHANFFGNNGIHRKYPIDPPLALRYAAWDVPREGLWDDVFYFTPGLQPLALRGNWHRRYLAWLGRPLALPRLAAAANAAGPLPVEPGHPLGAGAEEWLAHFRADDRVSSSMAVEDGGRVNSVVAHMKRGGYYRVELDPGYFRRKQIEYGVAQLDAAAAAALALPEPNPGYWRLFEESLAAFKAAGARLIVNEVEEAPFTYGNPIHRARWRRFMRERVQARVEAAGFVYVRADLDRLDDAHYFDYNHLNSRGAHAYAALLAEALRPHLPPGRR